MRGRALAAAAGPRRRRAGRRRHRGGRADRLRGASSPPRSPGGWSARRWRSCPRRWSGPCSCSLADLVARQAFAADRAAGRRRHRRSSARPTCCGCSPAPTASAVEADDDRDLTAEPPHAGRRGPDAGLRPGRGRPRPRRCRSRQGRITCIVGANACGKSTLLRALARLLKPRRRLGAPRRREHPPPADQGGRHAAGHPAAVADRPRRHHGRRPGRPRPLPAPEVVPAVVARPTRRSSPRRCGRPAPLELADRPVDELSGGQRQRVWIAMALAQGTDLMLLDEPTTYLDLAHQIDVLDLLVDLNRARRAHDRARAPRPQPGGPLQPPPGRDARRRRRRRRHARRR